MAGSSRATSSGSNARMSTRAGPLAILPAAQPAPARTTAAPTPLVVRMDGKLPATGTRPPACRLPTPRATMGAVLLEEIAETSAAVAASSARLAKVERLAACLRRLDPDEVHPAVAFLSGELRQRQIGVGWAALREVPPPAAVPSLTVAEVDAGFERIGRQAGPGSQAERRRLLAGLLGRATADEQRFLVRLLAGELRQGALEGVMVEATARAAGIPGAEVRRALMLRGALGPVADITARVPEAVETVLALPVGTAVLDGELIALRDDGWPHPFQVTAGRLGSKLGVERLRTAVPLTLFLFDVLHLDGEDLIDRDGAERHAALAAVTPEALRVPRTVTGDPAVAAAFLGDALARGHEGVLVKSLAVPYEAGRRGAGWVKIKPVHTLDLVVLAAEWGHGRRQGWLSNLHLGARDPEHGGFVMLGKTFKGLTDEMLAWQTTRLLEL